MAWANIFLCGKATFANWLVENGLKLNVIILGEGVRLIENSIMGSDGNFIEMESFEEGLQLLTCQLTSG